MPRAFLITNRRYLHVSNTEKGGAASEKRPSSASSSLSSIRAPPDETHSSTHVFTPTIQRTHGNPSSPEREVFTADGPESYCVLKPASPQASASYQIECSEWPQPLCLTRESPVVQQFLPYMRLGLDLRISDVLQSSAMKDPDNHPCPECGKKYSTSSNLARHRQTHRSVTDKKARKCPHCDKVYVSSPAYSMHVRTHSQGCQCPYCGKAFSRPWLLQGHIRTHTGEKPFKCPICEKAFADKSNLRAHIQTHSTSKPYICQRCGKAFALKSYLYKHEESSCMRVNR